MRGLVAAGVGASLAAAVALSSCDTTSHGPLPCKPIANPVKTPAPGASAYPSDTVWGFADLHAHPAIELAFGGQLVWGTALDSAPVDATQLPMIDSCPVETHDPNASSPVDHFVGTIAFPAISQQAHFAHAPVGDLSYRPSSAWPNARDVIHQQMNVSSIRRAYEGGLRLMFASTTDNQTVIALLQGPNFVNGFVPRTDADYKSAAAQLNLIEKMVDQNSNWMGIARDPAGARTLIQNGKLALVLSLEMDGLQPDQIEKLRSDFHVQHIIPVHLINNDVGGTASNSELFNSATAAVSSIYRDDHQSWRFMDVAASSMSGQQLGWPQTIGTILPVPIYVNFDQVSLGEYQGYCYQPLGPCTGTTAQPATFIQFGQENFRGLCSSVVDCGKQPHSGIARVSHLMDDQLIVDVSHMGYRSVVDALTAKRSDAGADAAPDYPLIASHGDIAHLCDSPGAPAGCHDSTIPPGSRSPRAAGERSLNGGHAREIVHRGGVLGLGVGVGGYATKTLLQARGGPLLSLGPSTTTGCVEITPDGSPAADGCAGTTNVVFANPKQPVQTLDVQTLGGITGTNLNAHPFVKVVLDGPDPNSTQQRVIMTPMQCSTQSCSASVDLGNPDTAVTIANGQVQLPGRAAFSVGACTPLSCTEAGACGSKTSSYTLDDIDSVYVEWQYLSCNEACQSDNGVSDEDHQCKDSWGSSTASTWTIEQASVAASAPGVAPITLTLGPRQETPVTVLGQNRGGLTLYGRWDRTASNANVDTSADLFRVTLTAGPDTNLPGASTQFAGANACLAVRESVGGRCVPAARPPPGSTECPAGWVSINQRGLFPKGHDLYTFFRGPQGTRNPVCGVDVAILDYDPSFSPWTVDSIHVEAIEDPVGHMVHRYGNIATNVADAGMGAIAFGTDFNGLNGMLDISENGLPADATNPSSCLVTGDDDATDGTPPDDGAGDGGAEGGEGGAPPAPGTVMAPMRFRRADGSLGDQVRIDERGLATYGLLADMVAIVRSDFGTCGTDVYDSLMLSAEGTLRAWEAIVDPVTAAGRPPLPAPPNSFAACDVGAAPDAGLSP